MSPRRTPRARAPPRVADGASATGLRLETDTRPPAQCLTLAPVVALKADTASDADKAWLAGALRHIAEPPTGSAARDVRALSARISRCVLLSRFLFRVCVWQLALTCGCARRRLVEELGLRSTLEQYGVPRGDIAEVARLTLGSDEDPLYGRIVELLENLYA